MSLVSYHYSDNKNTGRAWVTINNPPVNATSQEVRSGLLQAIKQAESDGCRTGIIICAGKTFIAGGDISEFGNPPQTPHLPDVYLALEQSSVIWAAALHGTVLGGGFELAMACHLRVAIAGTKFGLPEVNLGLIPGAGGTQRLPRLVGAALAAELVSTGRMIDAPALLASGGLDAVVTDDLDEQTCRLLDATAKHPLAVSERLILPVAPEFFSDIRTASAAKAKGADAPLLNIEAVQWATQTTFPEGQARERKRHLELRDSKQSIALRHVFFAERSAARPEAIVNQNPAAIENIAVVGGGLMGAGIASSCLMAGFNVHLIEQDKKSVAAAEDRVQKILQGALRRGKISADNYEKQCKCFTASNNYGNANNANIAIEAVFEDLTVKQKVFTQLAKNLSESAIIATNTSYLDPHLIAADINNPARVVGLHFFSPAHIMKLLEIVKTKDTSAQVLATAFKFAKKLKKVAVLCGVCDGFIGNRLLAAYRRQADYLLADGALPQQIDAAMRSYGMPMGPYELQDLTGLQIGWASRKQQAAHRSKKERYVTIADQLCELERFGQRGGKGWYRYKDNSRTPGVDESVTALVEGYSRKAGIVRRSFTGRQIQQSLLAVMANEGMKIIEEGIAASASDIDVVKIHGYGFPRWRGGPMHMAQQMGDSRLKELMAVVSKQSPDSWVIAKAYR